MNLLKKPLDSDVSKFIIRYFLIKFGQIEEYIPHHIL